MDTKYEANLKAAGLMFFGAITAGVTHELINVISIINEVGGLLDDMRYGYEGGHTIEGGKLGKLHEHLMRQIERGEGIIKRLNVFAHTTDEEAARFDLNTVLSNLVHLMQRLAERRKAKLQYDSSEESLECFGNSFELQLAVFRGINCLLEVAKENAVLNISVQKQNGNITIRIECSGITVKSLNETDTSIIKKIADNHHGFMETQTERNRFSIILSLPDAREPK